MEDERPTHLDLFSGIGGFALAAQWAGFRTIGFCEIDRYCQRVLAKNFLAYARCECVSVGREAGNLASETRATKTHGKERERVRDSVSDGCSITGDIFDFDGAQFRGGVDLITGGFPCQPFSCAGKRAGKADDRHLWPEMLRVIKGSRPAWVLGENVAGIIGMELDSVLSDLEAIGYATRPFVIPACGVDAKHRRNRVWIVAYDAMSGQPHNQRGTTHEGLDWCERTMRNGRRLGADDSYADEQSPRRIAIAREEYCEWLPEPDVGRVAHGIPARVDRLRGLGNAIVPQVAFEILKEIRKLI